MLLRLLFIGIVLPLLLLISSPTHTNSEIQRYTTGHVYCNKISSNEGAEWLQKIFTCSGREGYCLPDEEKVLSDRFQRFIKDSNTFFMFAYDRNPEEQKEAKEAYKANWESIYPLYKEETWPFGRGNGGVEKLQNVDIRSVGGQDYQVTIDFAPSYRTINRVTLIQEKGEYLIDYIQTETIDFEVEEGNRNLTFTQSWTWQYHNDDIDEKEIGHQGKITAYYDPKTKNWLMNRDTYGFLGEMFIWVIARPDATYLYSTSSPHPGEGGDIEVLQADWSTSNNLPPYLKKTGELKIFNTGISGIGLLLGEKYVYTGQSMAESTVLYLKRMEGMSFTPLFKLGSNFSGEPRLPYSFPEYLPSDFLVLEEETIFAGNQGKASIRLETVRDTLIEVEIP